MNYEGELEHCLVRTGPVLVAIAACAIGASCATFFGLRTMMTAGGAENWIIPLVVALVIGTGLFVVWHKLIQMVPILHDPAKRLAGLVLAGFATLMSIAISSWFIATSIGGDAAVRKHMTDHLAKQEERLRAAYYNASLEKTLVPEIQGAADQFGDLASTEQRGEVSGKNGSGPVVDMLRRTSENYRRLALDVQRNQDRIDATHGQAKALLGRMRGVIEDGQGAMDRQTRFGEATVTFQGLLTEIENSSMLSAIRKHRPIDVASFSAGQGDAFSKVKAANDQIAEKLRQSARAVQEAWVPVPPLTFSGMNPAMATVYYAGGVAGAWAVAIAIEMVPLMILLILTLGHSDKRVPYQKREPFSMRRSTANDDLDDERKRREKVG